MATAKQQTNTQLNPRQSWRKYAVNDGCNWLLQRQAAKLPGLQDRAAADLVPANQLHDDVLSHSSEERFSVVEKLERKTFFG